MAPQRCFLALELNIPENQDKLALVLCCLDSNSYPRYLLYWHRHRSRSECLSLYFIGRFTWMDSSSFSFPFGLWQHEGWGFSGGSVVKNPPANAGDGSLIPGLGRSLDEEMATHSSILAWRIPWTEEPGGLQSMGSQRVRHDWTTNTSTCFPDEETEALGDEASCPRSHTRKVGQISAGPLGTERVTASMSDPFSQNCCCCWLVAKLCLTSCDPMYYSPPGSSVHGIYQAIILEWAVTCFSRWSSWSSDWTHVSCIGRWTLYHRATWQAYLMKIFFLNFFLISCWRKRRNFLLKSAVHRGEEKDLPEKVNMPNVCGFRELREAWCLAA